MWKCGNVGEKDILKEEELRGEREHREIECKRKTCSEKGGDRR